MISCTSMDLTVTYRLTQLMQVIFFPLHQESTVCASSIKMSPCTSSSVQRYRMGNFSSWGKVPCHFLLTYWCYPAPWDAELWGQDQATSLKISEDSSMWESKWFPPLFLRFWFREIYWGEPEWSPTQGLWQRRGTRPLKTYHELEGRRCIGLALGLHHKREQEGRFSVNEVANTGTPRMWPKWFSFSYRTLISCQTSSLPDYNSQVFPVSFPTFNFTIIDSSQSFTISYLDNYSSRPIYLLEPPAWKCKRDHIPCLLQTISWFPTIHRLKPKLLNVPQLDSIF